MAGGCARGCSILLLSNTTISKRYKKLWVLLLLSPLWLPIVAYTAFEWFVDPFPNSIWALRVLNTKYLVHVRADLTIDGEPLVLERTFRCFEPVDYRFFVRTLKRRVGHPSNGQPGNSLVARTSKNRLFAIEAADACHVFAGENTSQLMLSNNQVQVPVVYEIFGNYPPERIDAYIARDQLLTGYHGVQVKQLMAEKIDNIDNTVMLRDWSSYDWFSRPYWGLNRLGNNLNLYTANFVYEIPEERWGSVMDLLNRTNSVGSVGYNKVRAEFDKYRAITEEAQLGRAYTLERFYALLVYALKYSGDVSLSHSNLGPLKPAWGESFTREPDLMWFLSALRPCDPTAYQKTVLAQPWLMQPTKYECASNQQGILRYYPLGGGRSPKPTFAIDGLIIQTDHTRGQLLAVDPKRIYGTANSEVSFIGGR